MYRTGLPPRSANQLLDLYPRARANAPGSAYAFWPRSSRLDYVTKVVEIIGEVDRFRYPDKLNRRKIRWQDILEWWFDPINRPNDPGPDRRAEWFSYVSQQFVYRFAWGLGSVIGVATDESRGDGFSSTRLEDWPLTGFPWIVFWLKELVTWGTLDPAAAYLLSRGQAYTRPAAEAMSADYYRLLSKKPDFDPLEPTRIRGWADAVISPVPVEQRPRPSALYRATLIEDFTEQALQRWRYCQ